MLHGHVSKEGAFTPADRLWRRPLAAADRPIVGDEEAGSVPPKIRELVANLERAGFSNRGGKGSHRNFVHPNVSRPVVLSGNLGDDAKQYQVRAVQLAIEESRR